MRQNLVIDRHARRLMRVSNAQLAAKSAADDSGSGWIEGYAAVWNNVDYQQEVMLKGCFARSIQQAIPAGKVKLMATHYRDGGDALECIGTITEAKEDDHGLWIHAALSSTQDAQDIRTKVLEGHIKGLSVGYVPVRWEVRNEDQEDGSVLQIVAHLECRLGEVTVTVRPANELAAITNAKTLQTPPTAAQNTGKSATVPGATPATPPAAPPPPDLPRIKRGLALKRAHLSLLASEL